ncbi:hypothetical protein N7G274_010830 [Stereocaulon virgatum]|uniref:Uncharacterized protein n=1 Tax=Stereocaulon virgatum TaxID=373712 RepID=A0ABR3ZSV5_9LECA
MAQHARIEELSDSSSDSDPPEDDIDDVANIYIRPANISPATTSKPQRSPTPPKHSSSKLPNHHQNTSITNASTLSISTPTARAQRGGE